MNIGDVHELLKRLPDTDAIYNCMEAIKNQNEYKTLGLLIHIVYDIGKKSVCN